MMSFHTLSDVQATFLFTSDVECLTTVIPIAIKVWFCSYDIFQSLGVMHIMQIYIIAHEKDLAYGESEIGTWV